MNVETGMKKVATGAVVTLALAFMIMLPAGGPGRNSMNSSCRPDRIAAGV
ncbi:hypothetical protein ACFL6R_06135 [Gemmatimonadota bacterium]